MMKRKKREKEREEKWGNRNMPFINRAKLFIKCFIVANASMNMWSTINNIVCEEEKEMKITLFNANHF